MQDDKTQVDVDTSETDVEEEQSYNETDGDSSSSEETYQDADKFRELSDNYRKRAEKAEAELKKLRRGNPPLRHGSKKSTQTQVDPDDLYERARQAAREELESRDLEEMEYSDTVKDEIKAIAKAKGMSFRQAAKDGYIQYIVAEEQQKAKLNAAADNGAKKGTSVSTYDGSQPLSADKFDLDSEEGRKAYQEAKKVRAEYMRNNPS
jgi:hypothetical protein